MQLRYCRSSRIDRDVATQFDRYFQANDVSKGGSYYLQSKVYRAKELLEEYQTEKRMEEQQQRTKQ